jgi:hypothetical protein
MKHFVLTYLDGDQDRSETYAEYHGESDDFPVRASFWEDNYLVVPSWHTSKADAMEYIERLENRVAQSYSIVQERHYSQGDPRIADARIVAEFRSSFPIAPSWGKIQERSGDPAVEVRTAFIPTREAVQYVAAFNSDIEAARGLDCERAAPPSREEQ